MFLNWALFFFFISLLFYLMFCSKSKAVIKKVSYFIFLFISKLILSHYVKLEIGPLVEKKEKSQQGLLIPLLWSTKKPGSYVRIIQNVKTVYLLRQII